MKKQEYHPEPYWSDVAKRILDREDNNVIAGDDEPYYRYKRHRFLELLGSLSFAGKSVLEVGHGPGGNLNFVSKRKPKRLAGADISNDMIALARKNTSVTDFNKINGVELPFKNKEFDLIFTATVLQHNTDDAMFRKILAEICRSSGKQVAFFEKIEKEISGDDLCVGRPVSYYEMLCKEQGFRLKEVEFINVNISYYVCGAIRKGLNSSNRAEGEPLNGISVFLQNITLPITKILDKIFTAKRNVAKMVFERI